MKSAYLELLENTLSRYQQGGFLVGDYIKFADNYKSLEQFKKLPDEMKHAVDETAKLSDNMNLRVTAIKPKYPSRAPGNEFNQNGQVVIDVGLDYGGGRFYSVVTVPTDLLKRLDYGINYAPLPDATKRDNKITLKPEPVEMDSKSETYKQTRKTTQGDEDEESVTKLDNVNVKLPAVSAKSSAGVYLKYLK